MNEGVEVLKWTCLLCSGKNVVFMSMEKVGVTQLTKYLSIISVREDSRWDKSLRRIAELLTKCFRKEDLLMKQCVKYFVVVCFVVLIGVIGISCSDVRSSDVLLAI